MGFALSIQISALSWLLSTKYGLAIDEIGLVWAAGPIAGIFGQVIFGCGATIPGSGVADAGRSLFWAAYWLH